MGLRMRTVQSFSPHLPGSGPQGCLGSGLRLQPRSAPHLPRSRSQSPLCCLSSVGSAATLPTFALFGFQLMLAGAVSITTRPCSSRGAQKRSCLGKGLLQSTRPLRRPSSPSPAQAGLKDGDPTTSLDKLLQLSITPHCNRCFYCSTGFLLFHFVPITSPPVAGRCRLLSLALLPVLSSCSPGACCHLCPKGTLLVSVQPRSITDEEQVSFISNKKSRLYQKGKCILQTVSKITLKVLSETPPDRSRKVSLWLQDKC